MPRKMEPAPLSPRTAGPVAFRPVTFAGRTQAARRQLSGQITSPACSRPSGKQSGAISGLNRDGRLRSGIEHRGGDPLDRHVATLRHFFGLGSRDRLTALNRATRGNRRSAAAGVAAAAATAAAGLATAAAVMVRTSAPTRPPALVAAGLARVAGIAGVASIASIAGVAGIAFVAAAVVTTEAFPETVMATALFTAAGLANRHAGFATATAITVMTPSEPASLAAAAAGVAAAAAAAAVAAATAAGRGGGGGRGHRRGRIGARQPRRRYQQERSIHEVSSYRIASAQGRGRTRLELPTLGNPAAGAIRFLSVLAANPYVCSRPRKGRGSRDSANYFRQPGGPFFNRFPRSAQGAKPPELPESAAALCDLH